MRLNFYSSDFELWMNDTYVFSFLFCIMNE